jgi:hypothetical protein
MRLSPPARLVLISAVALVAAGCSKSDRPPLGVVTGSVTLDGQPLADVLVLFTPDSAGRTSRAVTGRDGHYQLAYLRDIMGANLGRHVVRITTVTDEKRGKERLPKRYHAATTLEAVVEPGPNKIDFALTSK